MEELITYVVIASVAAWVGWHVRGFILLANLAKDPDRIIKILEEVKKINDAEARGEINVEVADIDAVEVVTEQVNDLVYAYNKTTGEFLAQAQNLHQVMMLVAARYPGKKFWHQDIKQSSQTA